MSQISNSARGVAVLDDVELIWVSISTIQKGDTFEIVLDLKRIGELK